LRKRREEWEQDIRARQKNVVFPDTVQNEGRFWRNLINGKQKLTLVQVVGLALIFLTLVAILFRIAAERFRFGTSGNTSDRLVATLFSLASSAAVPLLLLVAIFLVLRWRVRRALAPGSRPDRHR
jgi:hypothetical protein